MKQNKNKSYNNLLLIYLYKVGQGWKPIQFRFQIAKLNWSHIEGDTHKLNWPMELNVRRGAYNFFIVVDFMEHIHCRVWMWSVYKKRYSIDFQCGCGLRACSRLVDFIQCYERIKINGLCVYLYINRKSNTIDR